MLDITTAMPGASPAEVEQRVTLANRERLVHQISGVEYVYSTSGPGQSLVIVRFLVGTPQEDALIKVYSKLYSNFDQMPPGVSQPLIKARSIDDVPILALTLWGEHYNGYQLRAIAAEMQHNFEQIADVSESDRHWRASAHDARGAQHRRSSMPMACRRWPSSGICKPPMPACRQEALRENNREVRVDAGNLFTSREDLESRRGRRRSWPSPYTCEMLPSRSWTAHPIQQTMCVFGTTRHAASSCTPGNILR